MAKFNKACCLLPADTSAVVEVTTIFTEAMLRPAKQVRLALDVPADSAAAVASLLRKLADELLAP